jgi:membrane protein implicated in regulation of membrane protease activity
MLNRTVILAIAAVIAIVVGVAAGFFELTVLGVIAAIVAIALGLRGRPAREAPGR